MTTLYHRDFDAEIAEEARAAARARACKFTQEDVDEAVAAAEMRGHAAGRAAGHAEGLAEARGEIGARQAEALQAIAPQLDRMIEDRLAHHAALERQMVGFALTVAEKVFPEFVATRSATAAAEEVRRTLALALHSPRLRVQLSAATRDLIAPEIEAMARNRLDAGAIEVAVDPALAEGEARVIWEDGFMEYSFEKICNGILDALRATAGRPAAPIRKAM
ncbi:FliH/SctL family protein [Solirhodobacter olei]|uniref:FliH/SctL family protein n=1 Tax=Solirhodobacter olei TaxID=2493082 RepID=UPI000FDA841D|nr:FliH/SctL family protein [Solirhodobacter olei]